MRKIIMATATAVSLLFCVAEAAPAQAAPVAPIGDQGLLKAGLSGIEKTQLYFFGGRQYCWYPIGWHGPGWYWCGYAWRRGFGWGGGYGWRGWGGPRPLVRGPGPRFVGPRGGPRFVGPRGGGPRGGGPRGGGPRGGGGHHH